MNLASPYWVFWLIFYSSDALAKRRRSGGSIGATDETFAWILMGLGVIAVIGVVITFIKEHGDLIGALLNIFYIGLGAVLLLEWAAGLNVDAVHCGYAELFDRNSLEEYCSTEDGQLRGLAQRIGLYALVLLIDVAPFAAAIFLIRRNKIHKERERRERAEQMVKLLAARMPYTMVPIHVARCEELLSALESNSKKKLSHDQIPRLVECEIDLTSRRFALGRELSAEEFITTLRGHGLLL